MAVAAQAARAEQLQGQGSQEENTPELIASTWGSCQPQARSTRHSEHLLHHQRSCACSLQPTSLSLWKPQVPGAMAWPLPGDGRGGTATPARATVSPTAPPQAPQRGRVSGLSPRAGRRMCSQASGQGLAAAARGAACGARAGGARPAPGIAPAAARPVAGRVGGNPIFRGGTWAPIPGQAANFSPGEALLERELSSAGLHVRWGRELLASAGRWQPRDL